MKPQSVPTLAALALIASVTSLRAQEARAPVVRYELRATVDDQTGGISGSGLIHYQQLTNSPISTLTLSLGYNSYRGDGFMRVMDVTVDGANAYLDWPEADSTVVRIKLPRPVAPGDSALIALRWQAQPPTRTPHTQRRGRRIDLVGWYPLLLDETSRMSVVSAAMSSHRLELDIANDQIIGGTGMPVCGDPGWQRAAASPQLTIAVKFQDCGNANPGRRVIIWSADAVTQLALSMSPTFRYEEGNIFERPVRVLYERGHENTWGAGIATRRTESALAWTIEIGGRYPWPHITVIQGLDSEDRALPMVLLTRAADQSALLHLTGLMISQQMLLGGSPIFTVGSAAFQTTWFFETLGRRGNYAALEREILDWDLDGLGRQDEPLRGSKVSSPCQTTYCRRTEFLQHQLRWWANDDELVRAVYERVIDRFLLKPATPGGFMMVSREIIKPDPSPLYAQLPTGHVLYDDAIKDIQRELLTDGTWRTTVLIERKEAGRFPQTVWVIGTHDTASTRAAMLGALEKVQVVTRTEPQRVVLDPLAESHDWNMLNNERGFTASFLSGLLNGGRRTDRYIDTYFSRHTARDRLTEGYAPLYWRNDAGGNFFGMRVRQDYLGRFEMNEAWLAMSTRNEHKSLHGQLKLRNPIWLRATGWSQSLELSRFEGRAGVNAGVAYRLPHHVAESAVTDLQTGLSWQTVTDTSYLVSYDDVGTTELLLGATHGNARGALSVLLTGGRAAANYARLIASARRRAALSARVMLGAHLYAGAIAGDAPTQRRLYISGADPYERWSSPFLRSRGALLAGGSTHYHAVGGAGVRMLGPDVNSRRVLAVTLEAERNLMISTTNLLDRIALAGFVDAATTASGDVADAGLSVRGDHRIGSTTFQTRLDVPLWRSESSMRKWVFSFTPSF
jgi:hypothetical protein